MKYNTFPALLYITCLFMLSCAGKTDNEKQESKSGTEHKETTLSVVLTGDQYKTAKIETGTIGYRTLSGTIKVNGLLDVPPQQMVSISAPLGGFLKASEMLQGKHVNKGDLIAVMQDASYIQMQQDYLDQKSQLEYLQADYERQKELSEENISAKKIFQQAKANLESMTAKVNGLKAKMRLINVNITGLEKGNIQSTVNLYAPITGYVTEVNVNIGKYVNPSDIMFEIVDPEHVHAELTVFDKDVPQIKIGQKVRFTLSNETKERIATVFLIGREISKDRTIRIHCHLDEEDMSLLPGMYLTAYIETKNLQQPALPDEAVLNYEGKKYIFIEEQNAPKDNTHHYKMVEVNTGVEEAGFTAVTLPESLDGKTTAIVIKGAYDVLSKLKNSGEEGE